MRACIESRKEEVIKMKTALVEPLVTRIVDRLTELASLNHELADSPGRCNTTTIRARSRGLQMAAGIVRSEAVEAGVIPGSAGGASTMKDCRPRTGRQRASPTLCSQ